MQQPCTCNDADLRAHGAEALCDPCRVEYERWMDDLILGHLNTLAEPTGLQEVYADAA